MADTYTTYLNLTKPQIGGDTDSWGTLLNADFDTIDAVFNSAGTGTSVGLNVGSGKTLTVAGTANITGGGSLGGTFSGSPTFSGTVTLGAGTANGVLYLNGSKNVTSGTALVFDGSNLGLGVTPSAWASGFRAIQISANTALWSSTTSGSGPTYLSNNEYFDGARKYLGTGLATEYQQNAGSHIWLTAASGTAGNAITFTQAMTLDASGQLILGTNPSTLWFGSTSGSFVKGTNTGGYLVFGYNASEYARFDSSGNLLVGTTTSPSGSGNLKVNGSVISNQFNTSSGQTGTLAQNASATIISGITGGAIYQIWLMTTDGNPDWSLFGAAFGRFGTGARTYTYGATGNVTLSNSGTNITITNTSASSVNLQYYLLRIA